VAGVFQFHRGLVLFRRFGAATASLPIIVLTNKDLTHEEKEYLRSNTGGLLLKHDPWREQLLRQVRGAASLLVEAK